MPARHKCQEIKGLASELLGRFLEGHDGAAFCFACLAAMLAMTRSEVIDAADRLRSAGEIEVREGRCANCGRSNVVVCGSVDSDRR